MTILAVSGIRDIHPDDIPKVIAALAEDIGAFREVRFGGARGVDTVALRAAHEMRVHSVDVDRHTTGFRRLVVYVPLTVVEQPADAARTIRECADGVVELKLYDLWKRSKTSAYYHRNERLVDGASRLLAFPNVNALGQGGTAYTIFVAKKRGMPVRLVPVRSRKPA